MTFEVELNRSDAQRFLEKLSQQLLEDEAMTLLLTARGEPAHPVIVLAMSDPALYVFEQVLELERKKGNGGQKNTST